MAGKDDLSEYEQQRLDNIARNQEVLKSLGLASKDGEKALSMKTETTSERKKPRQKKSEEVDLNVPVRKCSRLQGSRVKTYHECDAELDEIEREEARRLKMSQRQSMMPKRFKHEDYERERAPRRPKVKEAFVANAIEFKRLTHDEVMQTAPTLAKDKSFNKKEVEKLALFGFTVSHLQTSGYPDEKVQVFKEFMQLVKQPENPLVSSYQLRPYSPHQYTGINGNPHVICPFCHGHVCLTEQGIPRKHDCL